MKIIVCEGFRFREMRKITFCCLGQMQGGLRDMNMQQFLLLGCNVNEVAAVVC